MLVHHGVPGSQRYDTRPTRLDQLLDMFLTESVGDPLPIFFCFSMKWKNVYVQKDWTKSRNTRLLGPKFKRKTLQIIISPDAKEGASSQIGFGAHQAKLVFELPLSLIKISLPIVKYDFISCGPNHPTCHDDYFLEDDVIIVCSCLQYHVQRAEVSVPIDWDGSPTVSAKGALKK